MDRDGVIAWISLVGAVIATGLATAILLSGGEARMAGWAAAAGCVFLTIASISSHTDMARFLGAVAYRAFDALLLSSIAWVARGSDGSAAALIALAGGFLAAYFAARGRALGYDIEASTINRFLRTGLVALALLDTGRTSFWLWALAVLSVATAVVRGSQAFKEEMV